MFQSVKEMLVKVLYKEVIVSFALSDIFCAALYPFVKWHGFAKKKLFFSITGIPQIN